MKQKGDEKICPICKDKHDRNATCCHKDCTKELNMEKDRVRQRKRLTTKKGREAKYARVKRRNEYLKATIKGFTNKQWIDKLKRSKGICKLCGNKVGIYYLTLDHRFPVFKAYKRFLRTGKKTIYTIRKVDAICGKCNCKKKNK